MKEKRQELMELAYSIANTAKQRKDNLDAIGYNKDEEESSKANVVIEENTGLLKDLLSKVRVLTKSGMSDDELLTMCLLLAMVMFDAIRIDSNELFGFLNRNPISVSDVIESIKHGNLERYSQLSWMRGEYVMEPARAVVEFFGG